MTMVVEVVPGLEMEDQDLEAGVAVEEVLDLILEVAAVVTEVMDNMVVAVAPVGEVIRRALEMCRKDLETPVVGEASVSQVVR